MSTLEQKRKGYGIDIQIRDVTRFAERIEVSIDRFYRDEAQSGVAEKRRALRRLLRDCRRGMVRTVVLPSLDRLSRNVRLAENLFYEFEQLGVRVLIADMPTYDCRDRKDVMLRQIREVIAEKNRKDIIERLWKGRRERVLRGLPPGGNLAYGYRRNWRNVEIDAREAEIVRLIFQCVCWRRGGDEDCGLAERCGVQAPKRRNLDAEAGLRGPGTSRLVQQRFHSIRRRAGGKRGTDSARLRCWVDGPPGFSIWFSQRPLTVRSAGSYRWTESTR